MRIAIVHRGRAKVGGAESYLEDLIPALVQVGHEVAYWYELDDSAAAAQIELPENVMAWCAQAAGAGRALQALRDWSPDLIYAHGLPDPALEAAMPQIAPVVFFLHAYYGACISGKKSFDFPHARACGRPFGRPCLLYYFPRRCGGLNPATMWKNYREQTHRLEFLRRCRALVTNSEHMVSEYARYGLTAHQVPLPVLGAPATELAGEAVKRSDTPRRLLFVGRLHSTKGGQVLLEAAARFSAQLPGPWRMTFAGEGSARADWERRARQARTLSPELEVRFVGQVERRERDRLLADSDLLVVPSLWPEPFGLIGPEAGLLGVPAVAFDAGGIPDWLTDGVNGCLAPSDPPTAAGLADAIVRCLRDPAVHARQRRAAAEMARRFNMANHLAALTEVFRRACRSLPLSDDGTARPRAEISVPASAP